jgi:tRNA pseudouridine13 synthase
VSPHGRYAESWTRAAFDPPRAHGAPLPRAELKTQPEDFRVEEHLSFTPSGSGAHWLLRVEKKGANTRWVAAQIARLARVRAEEIGFAGLKDRHALAVQWFSVPAQAAPAEYFAGVRTAEFRVLEVCGNSRKLRRGALRANAFRIRLRNAAWSREQLELKLDAVRAHGVPNYFGPQRFGREGFNLQCLHAWAQDAQIPRGRIQRGFVLSAARSLIFNAVLARRVAAGNWSQLAPGDLANLDGSDSHFLVSSMDDGLRSRLARFDVHPSGPLWGRGAPLAGGAAAQYESDAVEDLQPVAALLAQQGLEQERRALRCPVRELQVESEPGSVTLSFVLGRSQYATTVLREICELGSAPAPEFEGE